MIHKRLSLLGLILVLAACATPKAATPLPTPEAIKVYYPASLQPWADRLASCATSVSAIGLYFIQSADSSLEINENDIMLAIRQPSQNITERYMFQVGWEQVVVVVNQSNSLTQISVNELKQIFNGRESTWVSGAGGAIQIWVLPDGEPLRQIFDNALELNQPLAADALLAPDLTAMLEAVSSDKNAIGYLPQSFLSMSASANIEKVKILQLEPSLDNYLHQPVLAITKSEPIGHGRDLLGCLQSFSNQSK